MFGIRRTSIRTTPTSTGAKSTPCDSTHTFEFTDGIYPVSCDQPGGHSGPHWNATSESGWLR